MSNPSSLPPLFSTPQPVATDAETLGAVGESALEFMQELGRCIARTTAELLSFMFLLQHSLCSVATPSVSPALHRLPDSTSSLDNEVTLLYAVSQIKVTNSVSVHDSFVKCYLVSRILRSRDSDN